MKELWESKKLRGKASSHVFGQQASFRKGIPFLSLFPIDSPAAIRKTYNFHVWLICWIKERILLNIGIQMDKITWRFGYEKKIFLQVIILIILIILLSLD